MTEKLFEEAKEIIERVLPLAKTNDAHQIKHIKSCAKVSVENGDIIKIDTSDYGLNPTTRTCSRASSTRITSTCARSRT